MNLESIFSAIIGGVVTAAIIAAGAFFWRYVALRRSDKSAEQELEDVFNYIGCIFPDKEFGVILTNRTAVPIVIREAFVIGDEAGDRFVLTSQEATQRSPFSKFRKETLLVSDARTNDLGHLPSDVVVIPPYAEMVFTAPYTHLDAMELIPISCEFLVGYSLPSGKRLLRIIQTTDQANKNFSSQNRLRETHASNA